MALAIDGTAHNAGTASSLTVTLSTSVANDLIMLFAQSNGGPAVSVTSAHLTWTKRASASPFDPFYIEEWWAVASGTLSSEVITVTETTSQPITIDAFGVSGANTASPFPVSAVTTNGATNPSINVPAGNTMVLGGFRLNEFPFSPDAPGGSFTAVTAVADFQLIQYLLSSTVQTGLTVSQSRITNGAIADVIAEAAAATPYILSNLSQPMPRRVEMIGY